jgi:ABC-type thiamine transport system substrate-binding protein
MQAASADFGFIAIAYNLKRLLNIKGKTLRTLFRSLKTLLIPVKKVRKSILRLFSPEPYSTPKN